MSASQCRCLGPTGKRDAGGRRAVIGWLGAMLVLAAGVLKPGRSPAQEAPAKAEVPREAEPAQVQPVEPLSNRYRFIETYSADDKPARPELIGQYKVGSKETVKQEIEKAQGAPDRDEGTIQMIYTERPAKVVKGEVTDLVRRYDEFRPGGSYETVKATPPLVKGLSVWCHLPKGSDPEIINLTENRPLREEEFGVIASKVFLPQLSAILPPMPCMVGDTWKIMPRGSRSLLGPAVPDDQEFSVEGKLREVRRSAKGTTLTAWLEISGELMIGESPAKVRAWVFFVFEPPPPLEPGAKPKTGADTGIIGARGSITKLQMVRQISMPIDPDGRLNRIITKNLTMERRPDNELLKLPEVPPVADRTNSWLRYDDPEGRFHFDHPQHLLVDLVESNRIDLVDHRPDGSKDALSIILPPNERQYRDPDQLRRILKENWDQKDYQVLPGVASWLPDRDWGPLKRKVYKLEAAAKPKALGGGGPRIERIYLDYYLITFDRNANLNLHVVAMTIRNRDHAMFAGQAEDVIRSFEFDQGGGRGARVLPSRPAARAGAAGAPATGAAPKAPARPSTAAPVPQDRP